MTPEHEGDRYGWRARIGFLAPGVVQEGLLYEFYQIAPAGVTLVVATLGLTDVTVEATEEALKQIDAQARELARREPDVMVVGGSPPVVVGGYGADARLVRRLEGATGVRTTTTQTAAVEAMQRLGMRRLAIATPFGDKMNRLLQAFLEASGFEVLHIGGWGREYRYVAWARLSDSYNLARETFAAAPKADGLYLAGASFSAVGNVARLEAELGVPVVASFPATLWKAFSMVGIGEPIQGFGRLLREPR